MYFSSKKRSFRNCSDEADILPPQMNILIFNEAVSGKLRTEMNYISHKNGS